MAVTVLNVSNFILPDFFLVEITNNTQNSWHIPYTM